MVSYQKCILSIWLSCEQLLIWLKLPCLLQMWIGRSSINCYLLFKLYYIFLVTYCLYVGSNRNTYGKWWWLFPSEISPPVSIMQSDWTWDNGFHVLRIVFCNMFHFDKSQDIIVNISFIHMSLAFIQVASHVICLFHFE